MQRRDAERWLPLAGRVASLFLTGALGVLGACQGTVDPSPSGPQGGSGSSSPPGTGLAGSGGSSSTTAGTGGTGSTVVGTAGSGGNSTGTGGSGGGGGSTTVVPVVFAPAPGAVRRLTRAAYLNSLRDLLGGRVNIGDLEPDSSNVGGFASVTAATGAISSSGVQNYLTAADAATTQVFADTARRDLLLGCKPQSTTDTTCFQSFVKTFGRLAWRQPLTTAQVTRYTQLISSLATSTGDAYEAMRLGMSTLLQSPNFVYRVEQGAPPAAGSSFGQYTSSEVASRLSYFLTNSTPDKTLLDLADNDGLRAVDGIQQQTTRLLGTMAGRESVGHFATELFQLATIANRAKDPTLFPQYTAALQSAMMQEIPAMFQALVFDQQGASAMDLFTTRKTFVTKELATLYGLPTTGLTSTALAAATLPTTGPRAGLLGTAAFLALNSGQAETSPTLRGKFIREVMMCQTLPPAPANVVTVLPDPPAGVTLTKRQRLAMHVVGGCAACHVQMDPFGFPAENFDAIGQYRATENGLPIDASGQFDGSTFTGIVELGQMLAGRPEVSDCLVQNFYRYATGHVEKASERPVLDLLKTQFRSGGYRVRDLLVAIVTSDGFRYVGPAQ